MTSYWPGISRYERYREQDRRAKEILGNKCARCGITYPIVWDHINDDGYEIRRASDRNRHSRNVSRMRTLIFAILRYGQSDVLQLLCPNCNTLKSLDPAEYSRPPTYGPLQ